ncbi:aminotransferase class III-fold pyridoxal phosphate-dependent enzyme [Roseivirga pacifica]|uniref:aminotransferase class III-fold pyridoxal phosphate-dependent enzyme n=1 Tax=Roseivirga pacifica TaxID=1267423 RepID=UPI003BA8F1F5
MNKGPELYNKAKSLIPGGTQLLSKRPEMFLPDHWPSYYSKAKGCAIWDLDDNKYLDFITMGIGACVLGYADDDVDDAVAAALRKGNMTSLNAPEEVALAEMFIDMHPWSDMVRYTRSGGEAMTVAVRIGRAASNKDKVMFCGYHGWHDWYLAANLSVDKALDGHLLPGLEPKGVPRALQGTALPFKFNDKEDFLRVFQKDADEIGVIVLEIIRNDQPDQEFLELISSTCKQHGIVFIVDEITSGWRLNLGGAHLLYGIEPDISVFGKTTSNGYPFGAVIGKKEVMEAAQTSFISSTYWTDRIGVAAAKRTIEKMVQLNAPEHLIKIGDLAQEGWSSLLQERNISHHTFGIAPLSHFGIKHKEAQVLKTYFTQEMLKRGYLASTVLYTSIAHTEEGLKNYLEVCGLVFDDIQNIINQGSFDNVLEGPVSHSGFKRLN